MRLEQLQYFLEIATSGSISIAAENLYISQSALSRSIKGLEEELGVQLFLRAVDGVRLTAAGEKLLPYMREVLSKAQDLSQAALTLAAPSSPQALSGQLNLCTIPIIADALLLPALEQLYQQFPAVKVNIQLLEDNDPLRLPFPENVDLLVWMNVDHTLDQALAELPYTLNPCSWTVFLWSLPAPTSWPAKKMITLEEALAYKLVSHHNGLDPDRFYGQLAALDHPLDVITKSNNSRVITQALLKQDAVLISNNQMIRMEYRDHQDLTVIPLKNHKGLYFALYDPQDPYRQVIKAFIESIKSVRAGL